VQLLCFLLLPYTTLFRSTAGCLPLVWPEFCLIPQRYSSVHGHSRMLVATGDPDQWSGQGKNAAQRLSGCTTADRIHHKFQYEYRSEEHTSELQSRENIVC